MSKQIRVRYFAFLREERGCSEETVVTAALTAGELYDELRAAHGFTLPQARLRAALNDAFVPWAQPLAEGDSLVFIPPVAGG